MTTLRQEFANIRAEFDDLKKSNLEMHARYATTLGVLRDLTAHTTESAQQAARAAQFSSEASEQCLAAAQQAAAVPVAQAAQAAADAARAAAHSAMQSAASAASAAAAAALAVSQHAEGASVQASSLAAEASKMRPHLPRRPCIFPTRRPSTCKARAADRLAPASAHAPAWARQS